MKVKDLKGVLDKLGMEWEESWIVRGQYKSVEVFYTNEQMVDFPEDEATSICCHDGWKEVERLLKMKGIL